MWVLVACAAALVLAVALTRPAGATRRGSGGPSGYSFQDVVRWAGRVDTALVQAGVSTLVDRPLVLALIARESNGNPEARGGAGERGLMQIMPAALNDYNAMSYLTPVPWEDMWQVEENLRVGCWFLNRKIDEMGQDRREGLRAYNRGTLGARRDRNAGAAYADWILERVPDFA